MRMNIFDKILFCIFKRYTIKIYKKGIIDSFNWSNNVDNVNDLSTTHKLS